MRTRDDNGGRNALQALQALGEDVKISKRRKTMKLRRVLALLMMVCAVGLLSVYMNSVRANGQADPCDGGDGSNGTPWKWGYCHQGHPICTGDATEVRNHTGHTIHGNKNDSNPPKGCFFQGCCVGAEEIKCDQKDGGGK
jgi:hypothetical protein